MITAKEARALLPQNTTSARARTEILSSLEVLITQRANLGYDFCEVFFDRGTEAAIAVSALHAEGFYVTTRPFKTGTVVQVGW